MLVALYPFQLFLRFPLTLQLLLFANQRRPRVDPRIKHLTYFLLDQLILILLFFAQKLGKFRVVLLLEFLE